MPAPRSNNPSVHENLQRVNTPQQMARGYALNSFERPSMGLVGRDKTAGNDWYLLGRSLSQLGQAWDLASKVWIDRWKEKGIAEGRTLWTNTEEENQNRSKFKEFVESNPQYANDNPWVKVGFEQSRMRTLGLDMHTGLQKMMMEGNLYNEKDQSKVNAAVDSFIATYRDKWGLEKYDDPITMAEHFSPLQARAKEQIMGAWVENQRANRMEELKNQVVAEMSGLLETGNVQGAMAALEEAKKNGLLDRFSNDVALGAIKVAFDKTKNSKYLEMMKELSVNGAKLIDTPEGASFYKNSKDYLINEARKNEQYAYFQHQKAITQMVTIGATDIASKIDMTAPDAYQQWSKEFSKAYPNASEYDRMRSWNTALHYQESVIKRDTAWYSSPEGRQWTLDFMHEIRSSSKDGLEAGETMMKYAAMMNSSFAFNLGQTMVKHSLEGKDDIIAEENRDVKSIMQTNAQDFKQSTAEIRGEAMKGGVILDANNAKIAEAQYKMDFEKAVRHNLRNGKDFWKASHDGKDPLGTDLERIKEQAYQQAKTDILGNEKSKDTYVRLYNPALASTYHLLDTNSSADEVNLVGKFEKEFTSSLMNPNYFLTHSGMTRGLAKAIYRHTGGEVPTSPDQVLNIFKDTDKSLGIEGFAVNGKEIEVDFGEHLRWRGTAEDNLNKLRMMFRGYTFKAKKSENINNLIYNYE